MGFLKPKTPKPPAPTILTPQAFSPAPAAAGMRPTSATAGSADSNIRVGAQSYINSGYRKTDRTAGRRTLLGGG